MTDQNRLLQLAQMQGMAGTQGGPVAPYGGQSVPGNPVADYYGQAAAQDEQMAKLMAYLVGGGVGASVFGAPAIGLPVAGGALAAGVMADSYAQNARDIGNNFERFPAAPFHPPLPPPNVARNDGR